MATLFRCVQGHHWQDEFDDISIADGEIPCPECGRPSFACHPDRDHAQATEAYPVAVVADQPTTVQPPVDDPEATEIRPSPAFVPLADPSVEPPFVLPRKQPSAEASATKPGSNRRPTQAKPNIPGYEILSELGRGGMGVVYKARQTGLNRLVAIKMILTGSNADERERSRFRTEGEAIARLQHPNIVQVFEIGEHEGSPWFSLEYVDGGSLADRLKGDPLGFNESAQLVQTIAAAIHFAHEHGVVHRDLKPANILLQREESSMKLSKNSSETSGSKKMSSSALVSPRFVPKITDFGLAKKLDEEIHHTRSGMVVGTPSYMAPEQATQGGSIGPATDIFSLGVILYQLVTGRLPFIGETAMEVMIRVAQEEPPPPSRYVPRLPRDLETIILKCLEKEQTRRYRSAQDLAEDLRRFLAHEPILARPVRPLERLWRWVRRRPAIAGLIAVASLAVVSLLVTMAVYVQLERHRKADLRQKIEAALLRARQKAEANEWEAIPALLEAPRKLLEEEPSLSDLNEPIAELNRISLQHLHARKTFEAFTRLRTEAVFRASQETAAPTRERLKEIRDTLRSALATVGASPTSPPDLESAYTDEEKAEIRRGCYELLLLFADSLARVSVDHPTPPKANLLEALGVLDTAKKLGFNTPAFHLQRARLLKLAGREAESTQEREFANALKPQNDLDYYLLGLEYLLREDRLNDAELAFNAALRLNPSHFWATYFLAVCHIHQGELTAARNNLTTCLGQKPNEVRMLLMRGFVLGQMQMYQQAEEDFDQAIRLLTDKKDPNELYALLNYRAVTRLAQKRYAEALVDLDQAIQLYPEGYHAYVTRAEVLEKQSRSSDALASLDAAIDRALAMRQRNLVTDVTLSQLYQARYWMHAKAKNRAAAIADLDRIIALGLKGISETKQARLLRDRGHAYVRANELDKALASYDEAAKLDKTHADVHRWRGDVLLRQGKHEQAVAAYDRYLELGGKRDQTVLRLRALSLMEMKQFDRAALAYTQALELTPQDSQLLTQRGRAYLACKAWDLARKDFEAALAIRTSFDATLGHGQAMLQLNQFREAARDAEKAAKLAAGEAKSLYACAILLTQAAAKFDSSLRRQRDQLFDRAVTLLEQSLQARSTEQRATFWQDVVTNEPSLRPLRERPQFAALQRRYSPSRERP